MLYWVAFNHFLLFVFFLIPSNFFLSLSIFFVGFRHFISEWIQIDATMGKGLAGDFVLPFWYSAGARFVTSLFSKNSL